MGELSKQLRDVAVRVAPLGSLSGDTRWEAAELMRKAADALAAQQDEVREELSAWFNSLPCDSIGKEHWDKLLQTLGLEQGKSP